VFIYLHATFGLVVLVAWSSGSSDRCMHAVSDPWTTALLLIAGHSVGILENWKYNVFSKLAATTMLYYIVGYSEVFYGTQYDMYDRLKKDSCVIEKNLYVRIRQLRLIPHDWFF
jgi:hypothetical protein